MYACAGAYVGDVVEHEGQEGEEAGKGHLGFWKGLGWMDGSVSYLQFCTCDPFLRD